MKILVSACLLGCNCKYNGKNNLNEEVRCLAEQFTLIPICPEEFGGLPTPRIPSEILGAKVINKVNEDVTLAFQKGAIKALTIAQKEGCQYAILKEKSPSCGVKQIYDGTFTGRLINGMGITTRLLEANKIKTFSELDITTFLKEVVKK